MKAPCHWFWIGFAALAACAAPKQENIAEDDLLPQLLRGGSLEAVDAEVSFEEKVSSSYRRLFNWSRVEVESRPRFDFDEIWGFLKDSELVQREDPIWVGLWIGQLAMQAKASQSSRLARKQFLRNGESIDRITKEWISLAEDPLRSWDQRSRALMGLGWIDWSRRAINSRFSSDPPAWPQSSISIDKSVWSHDPELWGEFLGSGDPKEENLFLWTLYGFGWGTGAPDHSLYNLLTDQEFDLATLLNPTLLPKPTDAFPLLAFAFENSVSPRSEFRAQVWSSYRKLLHDRALPREVCLAALHCALWGGRQSLS